MAGVIDILNTSGEVEGKGILESAANFISSTISSLIFTPSTPSVGHASESDNKLTQISMSEISMHDSIDDCWVIIYDRVYDITNFLDQHPGGLDILMEYAGRDCTVAFAGHSNSAISSLKLYEIGILPPKERIYRWPGIMKLSSSALPE